MMHLRLSANAFERRHHVFETPDIEYTPLNVITLDQTNFNYIN